MVRAPMTNFVSPYKRFVNQRFPPAQRPLPQIGRSAGSNNILALIGLAGWNCLSPGVPGIIRGCMW